jgi:cytochrome b
VKHHVEALLARRSDSHTGHNPLGALMMLWLLTLVLSLGLTGWLQGTEADLGEEWLQNLHRYLGNALMLSAGLHATAALVVGRLERTRLIKAMGAGVKERY